MKFIYSFIILLLFANINRSFAISRDTLKGNEGMPVYSMLFIHNTAPKSCYIEYHELIKEYFNKGTQAYIRTCPNYKFHNKDISNVYTSSIDSFYIGHDFYKRILNNDSTKGILAKQLSAIPFKTYYYQLDDYEDLRINDSLKKIAFGIGAKNNLIEYLFFEIEHKNYLFVTDETALNTIPISNNFVQLFSSNEIKLLLLTHLPQYKEQLDFLSDYSLLKEWLSFFKKLNNENKK